MITTCPFWFNVIEAAIWMALATWLLYLALRTHSRLKTIFLFFFRRPLFFQCFRHDRNSDGRLVQTIRALPAQGHLCFVYRGLPDYLFRNRSECDRVMNQKEHEDLKGPEHGVSPSTHSPSAQGVGGR